MGNVIQLPRSPRSWTDQEREIFSQLQRFYNRCPLVDAFVDISEGHTDEMEPWISFARKGGDVIMSIAKTVTGIHPGYVVQHRSRTGHIDDLEEFAKQVIVDDMVPVNGTGR